MNIYRYGYIWRHQGLIVSPEREHTSRSDSARVAQCELQKQRMQLGLPKDAVVSILWRQTDSQLKA